MTRMVSRRLAPGFFGACAMLAGCGAAIGQPFDNARATAEIDRSLRSRQASGYGGRTQPCTSFFDVSNVRVVDRRVEGGRAQVEANFLVRSKHRIDAQAFAATGCYGAPSGGWRPGQSATSRETFRFEHWQSGWRLTP